MESSEICVSTTSKMDTTVVENIVNSSQDMTEWPEGVVPEASVCPPQRPSCSMDRCGDDHRYYRHGCTANVVEEEEEEERLLWQINNNTMLYNMISFATETPIKTCNMSLAWESPYNIMI